MLCADLVEVRWKDQSGHSRKTVANLEDISSSGVCLQMERPVPLDTRLRILHPKAQYEGNVRYCLFRDFGYFIGVQFAPGCRWSQKQYHPRHLLDLRRLVKRCAGRAGKSAEVSPAARQ